MEKPIFDITNLKKSILALSEFIMELKIGGRASTALAQIKNKDYKSVFTSSPKYRKKKIVLMGICCNSKDVSVKDYKIYT